MVNISFDFIRTPLGDCHPFFDVMRRDLSPSPPRRGAAEASAENPGGRCGGDLVNGCSHVLDAPKGRVTCTYGGGRYWDRTSDLCRVKANTPERATRDFATFPAHGALCMDRDGHGWTALD